MNLDYWLADEPPDYLLVVSVLSEVVLAILVYNLIRMRAVDVARKFRRAVADSDWQSTNQDRAGIAVMRHTLFLGIAAGLFAFMGWGVSLWAFYGIPQLTVLRLVVFSVPMVLVQLVTLLPLVEVYKTRYIATRAGIWQSRRGSSSRFIRWDQVNRIWEPNSMHPFSYLLVTDTAAMMVRMDMTGFSEFASLALEHLEAQKRPIGSYALEAFRGPAGKIWHSPPVEYERFVSDWERWSDHGGETP